MRTLVICTPERPVDVLEVPDSLSVLQLMTITQRLDAAGVDYELIPVSRNTDAEQLTTDVDRFADGLEYAAGVATNQPELCDECEEPITEHAEHCSANPNNCV
jgi:hypothetical protein